MISFPNAKINLGLRVLTKRADGYHNIESCFYPVNWTDILEIVENKTENINLTGLRVEGAPEDNLCWKAYRLVKRVHELSPVHIHLHKAIPTGGGIGGGSSDAAFTIKTLNALFSLGMNVEQMEEMAAQLGSDCPFFIKNESALAQGRGTQLEPFQPQLKGKKILMINPGIHISTREVYGKVRIGSDNTGEIKHVLAQPIDQWKGLLINDFEEVVFRQYPEIKNIKDLLYQNGALYASMTGSGSTVYGIFDPGPLNIKIPKEYLTWQGDL